MAFPWRNIFRRGARDAAEGGIRGLFGGIPRTRKEWADAARAQVKGDSWREAASRLKSKDAYLEGLRDLPRNPLALAFLGLSGVEAVDALRTDKGLKGEQRRRVAGWKTQAGERVGDTINDWLDEQAHTVEKGERGTAGSRIGALVGAEAAALPLLSKGRLLPSTALIMGGALAGAGAGALVDRFRGVGTPSAEETAAAKRRLQAARRAIWARQHGVEGY